MLPGSSQYWPGHERITFDELILGCLGVFVLLVSIKTAISPICAGRLIGVFVACAMKIAAIVRYTAEPARLNEYPVGTTSPTTVRRSPRFSSLAIKRGIAISADVVPMIRKISS
jgi:hypothetical protein